MRAAQIAQAASTPSLSLSRLFNWKTMAALFLGAVAVNGSDLLKMTLPSGDDVRISFMSGYHGQGCNQDQIHQIYQWLVNHITVGGKQLGVQVKYPNGISNQLVDGTLFAVKQFTATISEGFAHFSNLQITCSRPEL